MMRKTASSPFRDAERTFTEAVKRFPLLAAVDYMTDWVAEVLGGDPKAFIKIRRQRI